jgi:proline dehydrogenase
VWSTKDATDACFDESARALVRLVKEDIQASSGVPVISVVFGTHNWRSCNLILDELTAGGLASKTGSTEQPILELGDAVTDRIAVAQLYGALVFSTLDIDVYILLFYSYRHE